MRRTVNVSRARAFTLRLPYGEYYAERALWLFDRPITTTFPIRKRAFRAEIENRFSPADGIIAISSVRIPYDPIIGDRVSSSTETIPYTIEPVNNQPPAYSAPTVGHTVLWYPSLFRS